MAIETIDDGETGAAVRAIINGNFAKSLMLDPVAGVQVDGVTLTPAQAAAARAGLDEFAFRPRTLKEFIASFPGYTGLKTAIFGNSIVAGVGGGNMLQQVVYQGTGMVLSTKAGVAGNTSAQMLARVNTDIPDSTKVCFLLEGTNDGAASVTTQQHAENYRSIIENLLGRGILPVIIASPPHSTYPAAMEAYRVAEFLLAREFGISIYDPWMAYVDTTTGAWLAGSNIDVSHPNLATQEGAAAKILAFIAGSETPPAMGPRSNTSGTAAVCISGGNNYLLTDTNADGIADGWTKAGTATASIVDATVGFRGKFQKITNAGASGTPYMRKIITTGWSVGDRLLLVCVIEADASPTNGNVYLDVKHSGVNTNVINATVYDMAARRFFYEFTPTTLDQLEFYFKVNGTGTGAYIAFGEFDVHNLTGATPAV